MLLWLLSLLFWPFLIVWTLVGGGLSLPNGIDGVGW